VSKFFDNPYLYFWFSIPILILFGILNADGTFMVGFYDTYFVIQNPYLIGVISIAFGIIGFWYWLMQKLNRKLIKWMTIFHVVVTIDGILVAFIIEQLFRNLDLGYNNEIALVLTVILALVMLVQIIFPINLVISFFKKQIN